MGYWITSIALIAFGLVGAMSIGRPFFLVGLAMVLLGPIRRRAIAFWPPFLGVVAYNVAYWLTVPAYCSASGSPDGGATRATCTSFIGIPWPDDPSGLNVTPTAFLIANLIGLVAAVVAAGVVLGWLWIEREKRAAF